MKKPRVISHRFWIEGNEVEPENTVGQLKRALAAGIRSFETDVQVTVDGKLVILHGPLEDTTDGCGWAQYVTCDSIRDLSAGSKWGTAYKKERVPVLDEILEVIEAAGGGDQIWLNLELKNTPVAHPKAVEILGEALQHCPLNWVISSFDHDALKALKEQNPNLNTAFLNNGMIHNIAGYATSIGATGWNPDFSNLSESKMNEAKLAGLTVIPYTLNTEEQWKRAVYLGVDGIVTNYPKGLQKFLDSI